MKKYKLIIAGSRTISDIKILEKAIAYANIKPEEVSEVVSGKAQGVDTLGEEWADRYGIHVEPFEANWKDLKTPPVYIKKNQYGEYNALAGIVRNGKMAHYGDRLLAVIEDNSSGSSNMVEQMEQLGKPFIVYEV
jgi:hypothetical protein